MEDLIQEFISAQGATSSTEISRYNKHLRLGIELLAEMQLSKPNQEYYSVLEERFKSTQKSPETRRKALNRVRNFWEFKADKESQIDMFDEAENLAKPQETNASEEIHTVNASESKQGRKRTGKEKKTAKIMIYVEPSLLADIQDLAYSNRSSMVTLITGILEDYISANQDRLQKFRNL